MRDIAKGLVYTNEKCIGCNKCIRTCSCIGACVSTEPDENGNMMMYMTIKASKKKFLDNAVKELTKDKEMEVRFNEKQFRDSAFKVFVESNNKEYNEFKENQQ